MGRESHVRPLAPKFHHFGFRNVGRVRQNIDFCYKFAPKGLLPLSDFYKIWPGEGVLGPHPHTKFTVDGFKNVGLQPPKWPKW